MSVIHHSLVALRICGDDVVPKDITEILGASPTYACAKGEAGKHIVGPKVGDLRVAKSGIWKLDASDHEPEDIDGQIREIFSRVSADISVWQSITKKNRVNLSCGLFMSETNEGMSISTESLAILAERGIELWFDIYAPLRDIAPTDLCPCKSGKTYEECCAPKTST
jgi:hypothetical protein